MVGERGEGGEARKWHGQQSRNHQSVKTRAAGLDWSLISLPQAGRRRIVRRPAPGNTAGSRCAGAQSRGVLSRSGQQ